MASHNSGQQELTTPQRDIKKLAVRLIGSILAIVLLVYWVSQLGWQEILEALRQIPVEIFVLTFILIIFSRVVVAARWYSLLHFAGSRIPVKQVLRITFAGMFATNFLPTTIGGDVVRLAAGIQSGIDAALCAASLIVDRLIGVAGMAMVLPIGIGYVFTNLNLQQLLSARSAGHDLALSVPFGGLARKVWDRSLKFARRLYDALSIWIRNPRGLFSALGFTWLHMLILFSVLWLLIRGMGEELPFWTIGGLWTFVYFVTLVPISLNGLGLQEVSIAYVFSQAGGLPFETGITLALLFRLLVFLASLPGAVFLPMILSKSQGDPEVAAGGPAIDAAGSLE